MLESALATLFDTTVKVTGAGRTDAGVHATGQVISLQTDAAFPFDRLAVALRSLLPADLSVRAAELVEDGFSARFSACERTYVYAIRNAPERRALLARYAYHVPQRLDVGSMRAAGAYLAGEHDFRSFAAVPPQDRTVRRVERIDLDERGELLRLEITADGFLHHMVRTIVGTLVECGAGRREPREVAIALEARDRTAAGPTAPPQGLYLAGVRYKGGYDSYAEPPIFAAGASRGLTAPVAFP